MPAKLFRPVTNALIELDQKKPHALPSDRQVWALLAIGCVCLLGLHYSKYSTSFYSVVNWLDSVIAMGNSSWEQVIRQHPFRRLFQLTWWCFMHIVFCLLIPMLTIRFLFKQRVCDYGWQAGDVLSDWYYYLALITPILFFVLIASFGDDFTREYPFYDSAHLSWLDLLAWETLYIIQFIAIEFLFRGFILHGLYPRFGSLAIGVMCLPYMMLHFPKLWPEAAGAILFGFFLGILALKSRSIWGGVVVHITIALSMDFASLIQTGRIPIVLIRQ